MMASQLALSREEHSDVVFILMHIWDRIYNSSLVLDPTYPVIDKSAFKKCHWKDFYGDFSEAILEDALQARGQEADL